MRIERDVRLDRLLGQPQPLGDARVGAALGHQPEHLPLARGELVERVACRGASISVRDDLGVECGAAAGDAPGGIEEVVHVEHAVLEQVAEAAAGADEVDGVPGLDVLGQDEHGRAGVRTGGSRPPPSMPSSS